MQPLPRRSALVGRSCSTGIHPLVFDTLGDAHRKTGRRLDRTRFPCRTGPCDPARSRPADALGAAPVFTGKNKFDLLVELPTASDVCDCEPDLALLAALPARGIIVTAPADLPDVDFVSRFFAPSVGIPEDPGNGIRPLLPRAVLGRKTRDGDHDRVPVLGTGRDREGHAFRRPCPSCGPCGGGLLRHAPGLISRGTAA
jgi:Predicted epimerase, PhzC/PhzF homolog